MTDGRAEEREVLQSIYEENELKFTDDYTLEYRLGELDTLRSLVLKISWPEGYPDIPPIISLDSFYNGHISSTLKDTILQDLNLLAAEQLGTALTFSLIDQLKENSEKYFQLIDLDHSESKQSETIANVPTNSDDTDVKKTARRPQLTKSQKRRQLNRLDQNGELPRGWNWISLVKHLQQHPPEPVV
ncbi:RWD domain-containing protein 4 [Fasciola gigantica]|uniref:RWD domain-containing protein 4 n=1 Tax=Fasciola gigantica TaxID=46835 RepID=A0A504Y719_FASGI|nr:RWD domain-containing protein 4 [Fasciola gigantica]